jgi:hypothetical protein
VRIVINVRMMKFISSLAEAGLLIIGEVRLAEPRFQRCTPQRISGFHLEMGIYMYMEK